MQSAKSPFRPFYLLISSLFVHALSIAPSVVSLVVARRLQSTVLRAMISPPVHRRLYNLLLVVSLAFWDSDSGSACSGQALPNSRIRARLRLAAVIIAAPERMACRGCGTLWPKFVNGQGNLQEKGLCHLFCTCLTANG